MSSIVLALACWCSSGTLAPYATTLPEQYIKQSPEGYLFNLDHEHFQQVDLMVGGYPVKNWKNSHYLRRVLYSIFARPFTSNFGFHYGGVLFNVFLTLFSLFALRRFLETRYNPQTVKWGMWLFALYPGIQYWVGLPYHHASIIPLCLFQYIMLVKFAENPTAKWQTLCWMLLCFGVFGLSYDLLPIFAFAAALVAIEKKLSPWLIPGFALALAPSIAVNKILSFFVETDNANSRIIPTIVKSYFSESSFQTWWTNLSNLPKVFALNFLDSNFWILPIAFVLLLCVHYKAIFHKELRVAVYIFVALIAMLAFNNMAPPYEGWQLRGVWIARIYQPLFIPLFFFILCSLEYNGKNQMKAIFTRSIVTVTLVLNLMICFGGISGLDKLASITYHRFYQHSPEINYSKNLEKFGRRPIGF